MAFKLTKDEKVERDRVLTAARKAADEANATIEAVNALIAKARDEAETAIGGYNDALHDVRQWLEDVGQRIGDEIEDKSDKWKEGDRAQAASSWRDEFSHMDVEEFQPELPQDVEALDTEVLDRVAELPEEMGG